MIVEGLENYYRVGGGTELSHSLRNCINSGLSATGRYARSTMFVRLKLLTQGSCPYCRCTQVRRSHRCRNREYRTGVRPWERET